MRARFSAFLVSASLLFPAAAQAAERRPIVAVFDVQAKGIKLSRSLLERLSEYLSSRLAETGRYMVIPRDDLKKRLLGQKSKSYKHSATTARARSRWEERWPRTRRSQRR